MMTGRVSNIFMAGAPNKTKIKFQKEYRPASLAMVENIRSLEILKVFVVRDDRDRW